MFGAIVAGAAAGLASVPHCAGMCGPLAAFACRGGKNATLSYQGGRLFGYASAGALAGFAGTVITDWMSTPWAQALLSWSLALGLGLTAHRLWLAGASKPAQPLVQLGTKKKPSPWRPALFGLATTFLPCGALIAALMLAAGSGSALAGSLTMAAFAAISGLALLGAGLLAGKLQSVGATAKRGLAIALALGAIVLVLRPINALRGQPESCHTPTVASTQ